MSAFDDQDWIEAGGGDSETPTWDREGTVVGKLISKASGVGPNKSMLYTLEREEGNIGLWGSTVLDTKFEQIPTGAMVKVESLGKVTGKGGKSYNDFKVLFKPAVSANPDVAAVQQAMPGTTEVL